MEGEREGGEEEEQKEVGEGRGDKVGRSTKVIKNKECIQKYKILLKTKMSRVEASKFY